jgi:acetyl-CoA C-acetyltransferase
MSQPIERFGELNSMMSWAEIAAEKENITREEADKWSLRSHQNAISAIDSGNFDEEIVSVSIPTKKKEPFIFKTDETPRRDTSLEKLAKLKTVYPNGICTAGNSSTENDGAAATLLTSDKRAKELELEILGYIKSFAVTADDPSITYTAVPLSVKKALDKAELKINDIDLIEIQEAFACQALADAKMMGLSKEDCEKKVNINGSGISLGHPIGATGTMRLATLLYEMKRRGARYGLETICGGGGQAITVIVERRI